jgi:hypothetical protein
MLFEKSTLVSKIADSIGNSRPIAIRRIALFICIPECKNTMEGSLLAREPSIGYVTYRSIEILVRLLRYFFFFLAFFFAAFFFFAIILSPPFG